MYTLMASENYFPILIKIIILHLQLMLLNIKCFDSLGLVWFQIGKIKMVHET